MKLPLPFYARILLWLFLNLALLAAGLLIFFQAQFRLGLDVLLSGQTGNRIQSVSEVIAEELNAAPVSSWNDVLKRFSGAYKVQFFLFRADGTQAAGAPVELPAEVRAKVTERRGAGMGMGLGPPPGRGRMRSADFQSGLSHPKFMLHTRPPSRYWVGVRIPVADSESARPGYTTLLAMSPKLSGGGLFIDLSSWAMVGFGVVLLSALLWFPLVRGVTRAISKMTVATEQIAEGQFEARVNIRRRDELGRLGQAINRMAARLAGFVAGQKRFLGDIAHELCSPISRIQMALGILEQRADPAQKAYVDDVREEVQHMSGLVNELLSFSRASLRPKELKLEPVVLAALARQIVAREAPEPNPVEVRIAEDLQALGEPELLGRALSNLVRNALRYAGPAGPIIISASADQDSVKLTVADQGPGVPEDALPQIFDPFFRADPSRSRDTGGTGLGLAIVKTCVEACQGKVAARLRSPAGLEVELVLRAVPR